MAAILNGIDPSTTLARHSCLRSSSAKSFIFPVRRELKPRYLSYDHVERARIRIILWEIHENEPRARWINTTSRLALVESPKKSSNNMSIYTVRESTWMQFTMVRIIGENHGVSFVASQTRDIRTKCNWIMFTWRRYLLLVAPICRARMRVIGAPDATFVQYLSSIQRLRELFEMRPFS